DPNGTYTMCGGMYPWFVYGGGGFGVDHPVFGYIADEILYQPIPLETVSGDSNLTSRPVGQDQGTLDIDGDGVPDAVVHTPNASTWSVYRGDGATAGFFPAAGTAPFFFPVAPTAHLNFTSNSGPVQNFIDADQTSSLLDINGDGLPDRWHGTNDSDLGENPTIDINDGTTFRPGEIV